MLKILSRWLDMIEDIFVIIACFILFVFTAGIVTEVIFRVFFGRSFQFTIEYTEYSLIFIPLLGAAWLLRKNGHITIDLVGDLLPAKIIKILDKIIILVAMIIALLLTWYGTIVSLEYFDMNMRANTVLQTQLFYIISIIPISFFVIFLELIRKLYQSFKKTTNEE